MATKFSIIALALMLGALLIGTAYGSVRADARSSDVRSGVKRTFSADSDPQQRLGNLGAAPAADPQQPPPSRPCPDPPCFDPSFGRTPTAFLNWVAGDVGAFWRKSVGGAGYQWQSARQVIIGPGKTAKSRCYAAAVTSSDGPFYCSDDRPGTVFLPTETLRTFVLHARTWNPWRKHDFALAYVVAHEWGHHLQDVLGILDKSKLKPIQIELQADCLAGVWAYSTWARDLLEPGDIREAVALARLAGDTPGTSKNDPQAHGTSAQRAGWFNRGYTNGEASSCIVPAA